jgi:homoserine dehydrogenase
LHFPNPTTFCPYMTDTFLAKLQDWLKLGVHVVTPNKKANSGDLTRFELTKQAALDGNAFWLYEGTIGAGLPIVSTLRTLRASGDTIRVVQGIFSGTMSFLFNVWDPTKPFSDVVFQAKQAGYTEPDPRDDLNGLDVARKVVIAAREAGLDLSLHDVDVASLVPAELEDCSVEEYLTRLPEFDSVIARQAMEADAEGKVLRFVGKVDVVAKTGTVELAKFPKDHPFATLQGADNIVEIQSMRYSAEMESTPLIIRGPGAGAQVTAGGVFGDVCKLGVMLGARVPL